MIDTKMRKIVEQNPLLAIMRGIPDEILIDYVEAIYRGGVRFFEVALNTPGALGQIARLKKHFGDRILLGAGTAITVERARAAIDAGAEFLLSPSTDEDVLAFCEREGIPMLPGALTPSDVTCCMRHGFYTIKLFPAVDMPMNYAKHLQGPLDETEYVAIGGVNRENMTEFLRNGCLGVGLGSNVVPKEIVAARDWEAATAYVASLVCEIEKVRKQV